MSQIVLDEHLGDTEVLEPLRRWITAVKIEDLAPDETLKDDRLLQMLRKQKQPAFVTLDAGFFHKNCCDRRYCLVSFVVPHQQQHRIPGLLRRSFHLPEFKSKTAGMGKVVRVNEERVEFWQVGGEKRQTLRFQ
ncbi:MAG: hypothetical protein AB7P69_14305 [Candidatus Binatia bacterium]